jgi:hypothetical protein
MHIPNIPKISQKYPKNIGKMTSNQSYKKKRYPKNIPKISQKYPKNIGKMI